MTKCSNCGIGCKYLTGPIGDLCESCYNILNPITNPQITNEEIEKSKLEEGDN